MEKQNNDTEDKSATVAHAINPAQHHSLQYNFVFDYYYSKPISLL